MHILTQLISNLAVTDGCVEKTFFGLKPWYHYLKTNPDCTVRDFTILSKDGTSDVALIILAVVDDMLRVAGLVAVGFIIYGGILYVTSQGSPDQTQKAQSTIQNALIGLVISILAVAIVNFLGGRLGGA